MGKCCCLCVLLIVATVILAVSIGVPLAVRKAKDKSNDLKSSGLDTACQATSYPTTCTQTLSSGNATDSRAVTRLSLQQTNTGVNNTWNDVLALNSANTNFSSVLDVCNETLAISQEQIQAAIIELQSINDTNGVEALNNIKAWVSGAMELHTTCVDALKDDLTIDQGSVLQFQTQHTDELFSNALAFVNALSKYGDDWTKWKNTAFSLIGDIGDLTGVSIPPLPGFGNRKLLSEASTDWMSESDELPSWIDAQTQRHLLQTSTYDVMVAQDGTGSFKTIQEAVDAHSTNTARLVIYVKTGRYEEQVIVPRKCQFLTIFGDGESTVITGSRSVMLTPKMTTFKSATLIVSGNGFIGRSFHVENTAGAAGHQAVAVRCSADKVAFFQVSFDSFQDTLYAHTFRQYYRDCTIQGTVDFIFGNAAASFQSCNVIAKKTTIQGQSNTYSAQGRTDPHQSTGLSFQNCTFDGTSDLKANTTYYPTYLGRPWKPYSVAVLLKSDLLGHIDPSGWLPWNQSSYGLYTSYFAEYQNYGAGSSTAKRVPWSHQIRDSTTASNYIANNFVQATTWVNNDIPLTTAL